MVPIRSLLSQFRLGILGRTLKVVLPSLSSLLLKESTDGAVTTLSGRLFQRFTTLFAK